MPVPVALRVEYCSNPVGIDVAEPRFSWQLADGNATQRAYQIIVASSEALLARERGDLWDSGRVESDESTHIAYAGRPPGSAARAHWKVRAWTESGATDYAAPAFWETGLLHSFDWRAVWIAPQHPAHLHRNGAAYLRKTFALEKPVASARLYVTARGIYIPFLNNARVGDDFFRPGWTDYGKRIQYQTYDVTSHVRQGKNAVGLILNKGWFAGDVAWVTEIYGKSMSALAQLMVTHTDGTKSVIGTDASWKTAAGPIVASGFLAGETYDARFDLGPWTGGDYDDAAWHAAGGAEAPQAPLVARVGPAIRQVRELTPKTISPGKLPGTFLVDMGQNMVGFVRLHVAGPAGATVILRHVEILDAAGLPYTDNLRRAKAIDQYTLAGKAGGETFEPHFTFHGFRYVEVSGWPGNEAPKVVDLTGVVIASDLPQTGEFECSDPMLNQLQHNIQWGQRGNFIEVPTDCPQRDERLGWMGDIQVFVRTAAFNAEVASFLTKWLDDVTDAQSAEGAFSDVSPAIEGFRHGAPAWGDAGCIVPWVLYERYGDRRLLMRKFDSMRRWVDYIHRNNPNLLWTKKTGNNYSDWLCINVEKPKDVIATAYFAHSCGIVADAAKVLGHAAAEEHYSALARDIRTAFCGAFVDSAGQIKGGTQTAYLLALNFELLPEKLRGAATAHLVADIHARNDHLSTGFLGVSYLLPTLADHGHFGLAMKLLMNDTFPSWGYSIRHGATTIWERWDGWTAEKGFQDPGMNSFNHYAYGSCGDFMYRYLAGINPDIARPGYKHFVLRPRPHAALRSCKARYESLYGVIGSDWSVSGKTFRWNVIVPANTTATAHVPCGEVRALGPGTHEIQTEWIA